MKRLFLIAFTMFIVSIPTFAGGLLTNTNQNVAFLRNIARGATLQIDGVYSNPAGTAYLRDGFHLSLNGQSAFQTRTITSTFGPFAGFGGSNTKVFKGEASAPFIPSFQAAYKRGDWTYSAGFAITGGGGKATFNDGLASFESRVAMIPYTPNPQDKKKKLFPEMDKYEVKSFMEGRQYIFGLQMGAAYKVTDYLSLFGGIRMNYVSNSYYGYIRGISANLDGINMVNLNQYFTGAAAQLNAGAAAANAAGNATQAQMLTAKADAATAVAKLTADKELDCSQTGWGVTPIIGADLNLGRLNIGVKYEMNTKLNIENQTKVNTTGVAAFDHGVNTPNDIPSLLTIGAQYSILPSVRASLGWNHFFDTHAKMANNKQKYLSGGTNEYLAGLEWDITKRVLVSGGFQSTNYGIKDDFQSDMSFTVNSYSVGMGAAFKLTPKMTLNVAYFLTKYDNYTKDVKIVDANSVGYNGTPLPGTDIFTRTNKVFGVGVDYTF